jgi:WD40 repeat protein
LFISSKRNIIADATSVGDLILVTHDVFISYSNHDKAVADALCATLENRKIRCWVAPRDIIPGTDYATALIENLSSSRIMVLVFSKESNNSSHVMREVERAVSKGIPIIPLRIDDVTPTKAMEYYLSSPHWLDALTPPLERHLQKLADTVQTLLQSEVEKSSITKAPNPSPQVVSKDKNKKRNRTILAAASALIVVLIISAVFLTGAFSGTNKNLVSPEPSTSPTNTPTSPSTTPTSTGAQFTPSTSPITPSPSIPLTEGAISAANAAQVGQTRQVSSDWAHQVAWSPDGNLFAVATYHIDVYNAKTMNLTYTIDSVTWPNSIAFSSDSRIIAAGDSSGLHAWNTDGWGQYLSNPNAGNIACLGFSPDGKTVAGAVGGTVKLWDITTGDEIRTIPAGNIVGAVAFSPDGRTLASGGSNGGLDVKLWDPKTGQELKTLSGHSSEVQSLAFSPNSQTLASASFDKRIILWNVSSGAQLRVITGHTDQITSVAFSPNGQVIASASWDLTVRLWDAQNGKQLNALTGHSSWIFSVAFSPDGVTLASGADDQAVRLWAIK